MSALCTGPCPWRHLNQKCLFGAHNMNLKSSFWIAVRMPRNFSLKVLRSMSHFDHAQTLAYLGQEESEVPHSDTHPIMCSVNTWNPVPQNARTRSHQIGRHINKFLNFDQCIRNQFLSSGWILSLQLKTWRTQKLLVLIRYVAELMQGIVTSMGMGGWWNKQTPHRQVENPDHTAVAPNVGKTPQHLSDSNFKQAWCSVELCVPNRQR